MVDACYNDHFGPHEKVVIMEVFENVYLFLSITIKYIYFFKEITYGLRYSYKVLKKNY